MKALSGEAETTRASLELLYDIGRELSSALDLQTVLRRVLLLSVKNVGAQNGSIIVLDEAENAVESTIVVGDRFIEHTTAQLEGILRDGLAGWVLQNRQSALIPDTALDHRWLPRPDYRNQTMSRKSAVCVPLVGRDQLVGVLTLIHDTPGFFGEEHLGLIQAIADQAGIAVLNARLYAESQRQARVMTAVAESAAAITTSLELAEVLERILDQVSLALQVEVASLALVDPLDNSLLFVASTIQANDDFVGSRFPPDRGISGWVAQTGLPALVADVQQDGRFVREIDGAGCAHPRGLACAPIRTAGKVIGILQAVNPLTGTFETGASQALDEIGSLAGSVIQNAQLYELLQAAHQRYRELFEDNIDPILITDHTGHIVEANQQAILTLEIRPQELPGTPIGRLLSLDLQKTGQDFERITATATISYESMAHTGLAQTFPVQVHARRVQIDGGEYIQWIARDLRERKLLDSLRDDLISMIYHDLRSPLANIVSSLDVFEAMLPPDSDPAFRSLLKIAMRSVERIQRLTNSLLDYSRLESGQPVVNQFPTTPAVLARDAIEAVSPVAESKGQTLQNALPSNLPHVLVDADMIRRVLVNLLENAVKYTQAGGLIQLGAQVQDVWLQFFVQDNGPGISKADQDRLFHKFSRLHGKESQGLGLGLAYCRLAVEGHGGKVWVESQPDQGAKFCFTVPITKIKDE